MPVTKKDKLPCPHCNYEGWSQKDLDSHIAFVHGKAQPKGKAQAQEAPVQAAAKAEAAKVEIPVDESKLPAGIFVPKPLPDFWVSERVGKELYIIGKISKRGEPVNVKVLGPAGVGKTSLGWEFAAAHKRPCFEVQWGTYEEAGQVWGTDQLSMEKGTYHDQARYVDAFETPNCVVILDEPNRCPPQVLNANFALWDWRRAAYIPQLRRMVRVAPGVVFFACMNEGGEYIGTNPVDKAIRERFTRTIRLTWPPMKIESGIIRNRTGVDKEVAEKLARFARDVRRNPKVGCAPSTRQLLVAAQDVKEGLPLQDAVLYSIINDLDEGVDRTALLQHLQVIGNIDDAFVEGREEEEDDK